MTYKRFICFVLCLFVFFVTHIYSTSRVTINYKNFHVTTVSTPSDRARGLMFRNFLPQDHGMLFVFPTEDIYSFWMKNTYIPLDIIWIDSDFQIVDIAEKTIPMDETPITPLSSAKYVLELNAGQVSQNAIMRGQSVFIDQGEQ